MCKGGGEPRRICAGPTTWNKTRKYPQFDDQELWTQEKPTQLTLMQMRAENLRSKRRSPNRKTTDQLNPWTYSTHQYLHPIHNLPLYYDHWLCTDRPFPESVYNTSPAYNQVDTNYYGIIATREANSTCASANESRKTLGPKGDPRPGTEHHRTYGRIPPTNSYSLYTSYIIVDHWLCTNRPFPESVIPYLT